MATFNYQVKVGGDFKNFESELNNAVKNAKARFQEMNTEWSDLTIDIPIDKNFAANIKKQLDVIKKFAPELEPKIDVNNVRKLLDEYTQLKIAIDTKDATKAFDLIKEKFAELGKLYEISITKPKKESYFDDYEYEDALSNYKARMSERENKVANILNDILNYSETLINHKVIDRQGFSEALNSGLMQNKEILDDVLDVVKQKGISLSGGKEIQNLKAIIEALNQFALLNSQLEKVNTSGMKNAAEQLAESKETRKQRKEQAETEKANRPKSPPKNSLKLDVDDLNNRLDSQLSETAEAAEKAENSIKELNSVAIKINTDEFDELYEQLNKLQSEPIVLKASVEPEVKEQLENLLKIKEDLIASGTIKLKLSASTINSVNDLRDKIDSLKYDIISSMSQPVELKGEVGEQFKTSINELKDTLDSITKKSRTIRFKISEATNRDIAELNERLNSLSQKLIAESKEVSNVLETTAKQSEVSISNIPTVKINVNADSIDELAYKIISLEELLNSVVTVKGKVDDSIYTELERLKVKLNEIEEKQRLINFKINDNIDLQITELKNRLDKLVTDRVLDGNFKIDASVVSALSDNGDIVNNLQKIDETLNNVINTMKALNSISDNVQENILSMGVDSINQMSSALDRLISRINVLLGYEVAPEEVDKVRKMLSNAQKSRKLNAEQRKPLKASNAKLNALSHADEVDHNALRQALNEAYSLLGINPNVEKIKEVPVYVERTAKATKKATETTKEYAEQQEIFNNLLNDYKTNMVELAKSNKDPLFYYPEASDSYIKIQGFLDGIAKTSDSEVKENMENMFSKVNSEILDKFYNASAEKLSKLNSQISSHPYLSSSGNLVPYYDQLKKDRKKINESNLSPKLLSEFYTNMGMFKSDIAEDLSKYESKVNDLNKYLKSYKSIGDSIVNLKPIDNEAVDKIEEYKSRIINFKNTIDEETYSILEKDFDNINAEFAKSFKNKKSEQINKLSELLANPLYKDNDKVIALINELKSIEGLDFKKINQSTKNIQELFDSIEPKTIKEGNLTKLNKIIGDLKAYTANPKYSGIPSTLKQQGNELLGEANKLLKDGFSSEQLKELNAQVVAYKGEIGKLGKTMSTTASVAFKLSEMNARFIAQFFSFYDLIRYGREFLNVIIQIDTAVGELRKVSNETDERLAASLKTSTKTAKELGASISEIVNATSDWSRLGYGIDEAEQLAKVSQLYVNVGDGIDMDSANESLISTLQGFQLPVDEAESIIDKFNEVANNYAIDTAGIGEALQRSAASFYAANTDLSKSIALVTTANTVLQNPDTVGTTFKTNLCLCV